MGESPSPDELLRNAVFCGGWYLRTDTLLQAVDLLRTQLVTVEDTLDGIRIRPTPSGVSLCLERGLVVQDVDRPGEYRFPPQQRSDP